jgi:hypothetical protein
MAQLCITTGGNAMTYEQMIAWFWANKYNVPELLKARHNPNWGWLRVDVDELIAAQGDEELEHYALLDIESTILERQAYVRSLPYSE